MNLAGYATALLPSPDSPWPFIPYPRNLAYNLPLPPPAPRAIDTQCQPPPLTFMELEDISSDGKLGVCTGLLLKNYNTHCFENAGISCPSRYNPSHCGFSLYLWHVHANNFHLYSKTHFDGVAKLQQILMTPLLMIPQQFWWCVLRKHFSLAYEDRYVLHEVNLISNCWQRKEREPRRQQIFTMTVNYFWWLDQHLGGVKRALIFQNPKSGQKCVHSQPTVHFISVNSSISYEKQ